MFWPLGCVVFYPERGIVEKANAVMNRNGHRGVVVDDDSGTCAACCCARG